MTKYGLIPLMFFIATGFCVLRGAILQFRFYRYLRDNHFEKWKYLTSFLCFGPGCANSFRGMPFLYNSDDLGDKAVLMYKIKIRHSILYAITGGIAMMLTGLLITLFFEIPS